MAKLDRNMITITQAAELAGCSGGYVRRMLRAGKIDGVKITERMWLVSKRDVLALSKELSTRARKNS
jgi:excisionase family DNA binding protein